MPAVYKKLGIRFQYPDNWTIDEVEALEGNNSVAVYSPGGGFWSIMIPPPGTSPTDLVEAALSAMRQQYDDLDVESVSETIGRHKLVGYDLNFFYLDLTSTAQVRSYVTERAAYVVFCQADDREFADIELVFRAITLSLLK